MFWGCLSISDIGTLIIIVRMVNSYCYTELIRQTVTRNMQRSFSEGGGVF